MARKLATYLVINNVRYHIAKKCIFRFSKKLRNNHNMIFDNKTD